MPLVPSYDPASYILKGDILILLQQSHQQIDSCNSTNISSVSKVLLVVAQMNKSKF